MARRPRGRRGRTSAPTRRQRTQAGLAAPLASSAELTLARSEPRTGTHTTDRSSEHTDLMTSGTSSIHLLCDPSGLPQRKLSDQALCRSGAFCDLQCPRGCPRAAEKTSDPRFCGRSICAMASIETRTLRPTESATCSTRPRGSPRTSRRPPGCNGFAVRDSVSRYRSPATWSRPQRSDVARAPAEHVPQLLVLQGQSRVLRQESLDIVAKPDDLLVLVSDGGSGVRDRCCGTGVPGRTDGRRGPSDARPGPRRR